MTHDFNEQPQGEAADQFRAWLERETVDSLSRSYGNAEATKSAIFLYVNRAYEAHMPELDIGELFGRCTIRAGFLEEDEKPAFDWLEYFTQIAAQVHRSA